MLHLLQNHLLFPLAIIGALLPLLFSFSVCLPPVSVLRLFLQPSSSHILVPFALFFLLPPSSFSFFSLPPFPSFKLSFLFSCKALFFFCLPLFLFFCSQFLLLFSYFIFKLPLLILRFNLFFCLCIVHQILHLYRCSH